MTDAEKLRINQIAECLRKDALDMDIASTRMVRVQTTFRNAADNLRKYAEALSSEAS